MYGILYSIYFLIHCQSMGFTEIVRNINIEGLEGLKMNAQKVFVNMILM